MKSDEVNQVFQAGRTQELIYELRVEQAMTRKVITVKPDNTIEDVRRLLKEHRISSTPVIKAGELVGIVSIEDLIRSLCEGRIHEPVKQRMSTNVVTLFKDEPLVHAVEKFERYGYGRFPVIDRKTHKLVGILSKVDIIRCLLRRLEVNYHKQELQQYRANHWYAQLCSDRSAVMLRYAVEGGNFEKAGQASSRLKRDLKMLGIPPQVARRIAIASYEAEMNIVIFTPGGELVATVEPKKITVTAADHGPGIPDIDLAMQPGYSTAPDWVRELGFGAGMGLPNIKNCSDEMRIDSRVREGTNLQFTVYT